MNNNYQIDFQKATESQVLIYLVNGLNYYKDREDKTYVELIDPNNNIKFVETHSEDFELYLKNWFIHLKNDIPTTSNVKTIMGYATSKAQESGLLVDVGVRFAGYENVVFIDTANKKGEVIQVTADGWYIFPTVPVKFRRRPSQLPLATPDPNGDVTLILKYINLPPGPDQMLYLAALCTLPLTHINRPIIGMMGPAGSAKTTAAKLTRAVWDPFNGTSNNTRWNADDLAVTFYSNAIPLFDNIGKFKDEISDIFCATITGADLIKRTQYTNDGQFHISYQRPIVFTALDMPSTKSDFLDRCLSFYYEPISQHSRKDLNEVMTGFHNDLPKILGGCLSTLVSALRILPGINLPYKPRLADFAKYGSAIAEVLGYGQETFLEALVNNIEGHKQTVLLAEQPLASALVEHFHQHGGYEGPTIDLWNAIAQQCPYPSGGGKGWPTSVTGFGKMARKSEIVGILNESGLKLEFKTVRGKSHTSFFMQEVETVSPPSPIQGDPWKLVTTGASEQDLPEFKSQEEMDHPAAEVEPTQNPQQQRDNPFRTSEYQDNKND